MSGKLLLSVFIPNYNRSQEVVSLIESAGDCKNDPRIEFVIVDDASDIEKYHFLEKSLTDYSNVILKRNENNLGMTNNWNKAMKAANAPWLMLMCCDDIFQDNAVEKLLSYLEKLEEPVLIIQDPTQKNEYTLLPPGRSTASKLRLPLASGNVWHKKILETEGGFDTRLIYSPDAEYWYRIAMHYPVVLQNFNNVHYIQSQNNYMWKTWAKDDFIEQIELLASINLDNIYKDSISSGKRKIKVEQGVNQTIITILFNTFRRKECRQVFLKYIKYLIIHRINPVKSIRFIIQCTGILINHKYWISQKTKSG